MLRIALLGEQSIVDATTGAARSRSARTVALAAFLVVHAGAPQSRQRIAGLFWPDSGDAQALTNLRRELHALRHALAGEPCLVVTARDLCWRDAGAVRVDLREFASAARAARTAGAAGDLDAAAAHADAALAAYRGDLLPGAYDEWVLEARAQVADEAVRLCAAVCSWRSRRGDPAGALDAARLRIRLRPLEEAGYRELMALQARLGDRAAALGTYHRCASVLERELGVEPDAATRAAVARLLAVAVRPEPTGHPPAACGVAPFCGRARELDALRDAWHRAAAGRPGVVLVRGGAGVGKSRLVDELTEAARRGGAVAAVAQCFAGSGRLALAPVAEWLRSPEVAPAVAGLDPLWRAEVHRLVPPTGDRGGDRAAVGSRAMVDAWQRHRFYEGLARALLGVGRPTLLVLDNVQWCDQETLTFLGFCLGLVPDAPVLVAATLRGADDADVPAGWDAAVATAARTDLVLGPLDDEATGRLAEAVRGGPLPAADRHVLAAVTGGFPLHVVEAVRAGGSGALPAGNLDAVLRSRLAQAGAAAQDVAALAAAVGRDVSLDLLVAAGELDADAVVTAVDELWRLRILREQGPGYDFSHDLLRDAAYARITPARRWLLHRRVAAALEQLHGDDPAGAAQLAEQYARGGRPERALHHYRRAAEVASGVFAHAQALLMHDAALAIVRARPPGRDRDSDELAVLQQMAAPRNARCGYADAELQQILERSVELAEGLGRHGPLFDALVGLWTSRLVQGRLREAHALARRLLALVGDDATTAAGAAHFAYAGSVGFLGRSAESVEHFATALELTQGMLGTVGSRADVHGRAWVAHAHWLLGDDATAVALARGTVAHARSLDHPYSLAIALAYAAVTAQLRGEAAELRRAVAELNALCARYDFGYYREWGLVLDGWCRGGAEGVELARRGVDRLAADGARVRLPYWLSLLADLLDRAGDPAGARATLDRAAADARARDDVWWLPEVLRMRAAHDEDAEVATARLREAADLAAAHGSAALLARCAADLARAG